MKPLVAFDSLLGKLDEHGRPEGLTTRHGDLPTKPQRWRIVLAARCKEPLVRAEHEILPRKKVLLDDLVHGVVLPAIDEAIAEARETINEVLGVTDSESFVEISTEFKIYRWR